MAEAADEYRHALLEENPSFYVEGCPGCEVDLRKKSTTRLPVKDLLSMWIVVLCNGNVFLVSNISLPCSNPCP